MGAPSLEKDTQSFIIRVWREGQDDESALSSLRGTIDHVGSGQRVYFRDVGRVARFIEQQIGLAHEPSESWWKRVVSRLWKRP